MTNALNRRQLLALGTAALASPLLTACDGNSDNGPGNLIDVARSQAQFSTLVAAVEAAGLTSTLQGAGPFTLFAPTNDAFAALLTELGTTQDALLADTALLTAVLQYHVLGAKVPSSDVTPGAPVNPLAGGYFKIDDMDGGLVITDGRNRTAQITQANVAASNGVIHVIDHVLLPADLTVVGTAQAANGATPPEFTILVQAIQAAGLVEALGAAGPFTVFAPTDAAFASLLTELGVTADELLANTSLLTTVLTYHVVPALVLKAQVPVGQAIATLQGASFTVDDTLTITDGAGRTAAIVQTDVLASNGVIHVIDHVLLPTALT